MRRFLEAGAMMVFRKLFAVISVLFLILWGGPIEATPSYLVQSGQKDSQIQLIDQQIQELEDMKMGFEARALRHEDQADRLQFDDQTYLEMRRHNQLAAENRAKAAAVQKEIDRLQSEKNKLLGVSK